MFALLDKNERVRLQRSAIASATATQGSPSDSLAIQNKGSAGIALGSVASVPPSPRVGRGKRTRVKLTVGQRDLTGVVTGHAEQTHARYAASSSPGA